jgi:hypothetical protein
MRVNDVHYRRGSTTQIGPRFSYVADAPCRVSGGMPASPYRSFRLLFSFVPRVAYLIHFPAGQKWSARAACAAHPYIHQLAPKSGGGLESLHRQR